MKECFSCKLLCPNEAFAKNSRKSDGLEYRCRRCVSKDAKQKYRGNGSFRKEQYYRQNSKDILVKRKQTARSIAGRYRKLRYAAKNRGLDFDINIEQYKSLVAQNCQYCGGKLPEAGGGLDRIDSLQGYTMKNVVPCCHRCNIMKGDMTVDEFMNQIIVIYDKNTLS